MQRAAGCCWSASSLDTGDVPPAPIPLPRVRVLLGPMWEHQGCPERLPLGEKDLFLKLLKVGKSG